jgi:hypothetical protein
MYSKTVVLRNESQKAFDEFRRAYHANFSPTDRLQAALVPKSGRRSMTQEIKSTSIPYVLTFL